MPIDANQFFKQGRVTVVGNQATQPIQDTSAQGPHGIGKYVQNVKEDLTKRGGDIAQALTTKPQGTLLQKTGSVLQSGLRAVGAAAGGVNDIIGELPPVQAAGKAVIGAADAATGHNLKPAIGNATQKYEAWKLQHPDAAKNLESAVNIGSVLALATGGGEAADAAANTSKAVVGKTLETASAVGQKIGEAKTALSDAATHIPKTTQTALAEIGDKPQILENYTKLGKAAMTDIKNPTPMEYAGQVGSHALKRVQGQLDKIGEFKGKVLDAMGHNRLGAVGPEARTQLWSDLGKKVGIQLEKDGSIIGVKGRVPSITSPSEFKLVQQVDAKLAYLGKNPTLREVDDVVDSIQDYVFKAKQIGQVPLNTKVEAALKQVAHDLNTKLTKGRGLYADANAEYAHKLTLRNQLNDALGAEGNKGATMMKKLFGSDAASTRKLFTRVKDATGIDLANHAELAKFVMESLGDSRQANLLQEVLTGQVNPSAPGVIKHLIQTGLHKIQDPLGKAARIVESSQTKGR